jgi:hypothetical protein
MEAQGNQRDDKEGDIGFLTCSWFSGPLVINLAGQSKVSC